MFRSIIIAATAVAVLTLSGNGFAQQLGTADEAKAMLLKAVAALKADRDVTLGMINKGEGGFRDRDLYVFCVRMSDGKQLASGAVIPPIGTDQRTLKDSTGKAFGLELYAAGQKPEGEITEVSYMFPKPGTTAPPVSKVSFVTRVGDLGLRRRPLQVDRFNHDAVGCQTGTPTTPIFLCELHIACAASAPRALSGHLANAT
jgi:Single Cache domain 2